MGMEQHAKQLRDESNVIKKLGFEFLGSYTGLAAVPARFALERQAWNEAAALEPRNSKFPQAEAITYFARAIGSARGGDLAAAQEGVDKLKELRVTLEKANQSYWAEQVEIQMLAASAWIAQAKGQRRRRSNSCAPQRTWRIIAKSTSRWRTGFTRCASYWVTCCWSSSLRRH